MVNEAIILAGGFGKRLRPLTNDVPKPMVKINNRPMLDYHIQWLHEYGIKKIIIACSYKWEKIKEHYGDRLIYSVEESPLGTGGAVKKALEHIDDDSFIVVNSDDINDVDINKLSDVGPNVICVSKFRSPFGIVDIDKDNNVVGFRQKPILPHYVSIGVYLLSRNLKFPDIGSLEDDVFPNIKLKAYKHDGMWVTINTMKQLEEAEQFFNEHS